MNVPPPRRVVLDTDPGIDDALAILLGLASPEIDLVALSVVHGNCTLAEAVTNALAVAELAGRPDLAVAAGCDRPLLRPAVTAHDTHGAKGLGYASLSQSAAQPVAEHAVDVLIREVMAAPGEVTLVAVGPLTNVALALRKEPRMARAVRECIFMGGAFRAEGNITPLAEFNVFVDPHAAQIVFSSGMPLTIMPWDITRDVRLTQADVDRLLERGGPIPRFIADATRYYLEFHLQEFGWAGCSINDPAALSLAWWPELAQTRDLYVEVELASELTLGKTVGDFSGKSGRAPNARLVESFDAKEFIARFLRRMEDLADRLAA
ncbi:MAG: nucleoside hydrolase [Oscillochloridaceae bacterium]|nr:nucleoside hydrolase [Chloroflexaceae bacterium]MDW8391527.1 nucleoside hydrolase [Oscillochloridaceae bacterium]